MTTYEIWEMFTANISNRESLKTVSGIIHVQTVYDNICRQRDLQTAHCFYSTPEGMGEESDVETGYKKIDLPSDFSHFPVLSNSLYSPVWFKDATLGADRIFVIPTSDLANYARNNFYSFTQSIYTLEYSRDLGNWTLVYRYGDPIGNNPIEYTYIKEPEQLEGDKSPQLIPPRFHDVLVYGLYAGVNLTRGIFDTDMRTYAEHRRLFEEKKSEFFRWDNNVYVNKLQTS